MGTRARPPRLMKWRGNWIIKYFDPTAGKVRRLSCAARGAITAEQRRELLAEIVSAAVNARAEVQRRGGLLAYQTPLVEALDRYLADVGRRVEARAACPEGRAGLAPTTGLALRDSVARFKGWLVERKKDRLTTGELDGPTIAGWLDTLRGSPRTRNKHGRHLRCAVYWLADLRPPVFPDVEALRRAFRPVRAEAPAPACYSPELLRSLLVAAIERDSGSYVVPVTRLKGGRVERFEQPASSRPSLPLARLVLLLALTGARRGEVIALRWEDVDLDRGRLTLRSLKTGWSRVLPLIGAPEGEVAPRLVELMRRWKIEAGGRRYVLGDSDKAPEWPKTAWAGLVRAAEVELKPQGLRQTWCAVAASMGWPAAVAALVQGHGAAVAERWYRSLAVDRLAGAGDFEEALGLAPLLDRLLAGQEIAREATA